MISGPFMARFFVPMCYKSLNITLSYKTAYVILAIIGGVLGIVIAHYGQERYQKAHNARPWLLLGLLVPFGTALATAAIIWALHLVILVVTAVLYIVGIVIAVSCVCGLCLGD